MKNQKNVALKHTQLFSILQLFFVLISFYSYGTNFTMGTSGSQSATITATVGSPDKFYDDGGSGGNYNNNVDATYTFNCAGGKYVRIKLNSCATESSNDLIYVFDGTSTSDRLFGYVGRSGTLISNMYVSSTGSLTFKFVSNGTTVSSGWDIDIWVDDYPGQTWDGSTDTEISTASNWEGDVVPFNYYSNIYIPSGLTNYPVQSNSSNSLCIYDLRVATGATFTYSSTISGHGMFVYGDIIINGTFSHSSSYYIMCDGGTASAYSSLSGSGTLTNLKVDIGYNRLAYYKLSGSITVENINLDNALGASVFDMNGYNLTTFYCGIESSTLFYQRTGTLRIEETGATIDDGSFNEGTGTTYFSRGTTWVANNQTIPSITYYNLKVRTNNGYIATIGSGSVVTVTNDLTFTNVSTAGGIAENTNNDITVGNNLYIGNTGNALTLNLVNRLYRASGSGTLTMGNVSGHAINVTYASSTNFCIDGFGTPVFYGTFTYNSGSLQKILPATYTNLTVNGVGAKTLYGNTNVNSTLTLSNGLVYTSGYTLTIGTSSSNGSISGGSASCYLVAYDNSGTIGYVKQFVNSNASYAFPIGDATNYTPLTFILSAGTLTSAYLTVYTKATKIPGLNTDITSYINRYWDVSPSGISSPTYDISYTYTDSDIVGSEIGMLPIRKSGSLWYKPIGSSFTDGTAQGTGSLNAGSNLLTWTGLSSFSLFSGAVDGVIILPIELISFTGRKSGENNELKWETASEENTDFFLIEKTTDGQNFEVIGTKEGTGNSNMNIEYIWTDNHVQNVINYYRLKQVDYDGQFVYTDLISIDNQKVSSKEIVSYSNLLGQLVDENYSGLVIVIYNDGSTSIKILN